ncbi:hypothetical protein LCGC14_2530510, partial [marine sediment metagenome]
AVSEDKTKTSYRLNLARAYRYAGKGEKAEKELKAILAARSDHVEAGQLLAEVHAARKQWKQVVAVLEPLLKYRHDYTTYHLLAEAKHNLNDNQKARKYFEEAVKLNPKSAADHYSLGNIYLAGNFYALAAEAYRKALALGVDSPVLRYKLGSAYFNLRNYFGRVSVVTVKAGKADTISGDWYLIEPVPGRKDVFRAAPSGSAVYQIARAAADGFDIEYIHRDNRDGYKAGALANGLKTATGEYVAIFDADFLPEPDFLIRSMDYFTDPQVCAVQTRWEHINRDDSLLTRAQAIWLDGHFAIEHVARNRSGRFMAFNGTAGTWRKAAIDDAGGWQHDTLTEDMDLSYRAQLRGWKFVFLPEQTTPAELPSEMSAFKAQQFRWTKGGTQTAMKMLPRIMLSNAPLKAKVDAFLHLTCFSVHGYVVLLTLLLYPTMLIRYLSGTDPVTWRIALDMGVFTLATISASVFYVASQYELFRDWRTVLKYLPFL